VWYDDAHRRLHLPAGRQVERHQTDVIEKIPADFTLNRPTRSGRLPPHEKANYGVKTHFSYFWVSTCCGAFGGLWCRQL